MTPTIKDRQPLARIIALLLALPLALLLAACTTMEGAGKDVEKAGEAMQDAAD